MYHTRFNLVGLIIAWGCSLACVAIGAEGNTGCKLNVPPAGFRALFNGKDLLGWQGVLDKPYDNPIKRQQLSQEEYAERQAEANERMRKHWKVNNGVLDNTADKYKKLHDYQYHGSIYGVVPAKRGYLKPLGQWNSQEVIAVGNHITVNLNGHTIVDADIKKESTPQTRDGKAHPGLLRPKGHIAFLGHGDVLEFKDIKVKELQRP